MFLGGADGKTAELRAPSIKAALRFWWRALNVENDFSKVRKKESEIFGGAGENDQRSKFNLRLKYSEFEPCAKPFRKHEYKVPAKRGSIPINIIDYLAFGVIDNKTKSLSRQYIEQGFKFDVEVFSPYQDLGLAEEEFTLLFALMSVVGGLGSKSRNGFGRLQLLNRNIKTEDIIMAIQKRKNKMRDYTSFSEKTKVFKIKESFNSWDDCLAELGKIYKSSRESLKGNRDAKYLQYIASPINKTNTKLNRHSKLHFLSVVKNEGKYEGFIFFLPYNYASYFDKATGKSNELPAFIEATSLFNESLKAKMIGVL
jgi:CRISPR-associated protein Cmr1